MYDFSIVPIEYYLCTKFHVYMTSLSKVIENGGMSIEMLMSAEKSKSANIGHFLKWLLPFDLNKIFLFRYQSFWRTINNVDDDNYHSNDINWNFIYGTLFLWNR